MEEIKKIFLIPKIFFQEDGFIERLKLKIAEISTKYGKYPREEIRNELNILNTLAYQKIANKQIRLNMHIFLLKANLEYARKFQSIETYQNILNTIDNQEFKQKMASKHIYEYKIIKAEALFGKFNAILNEKNNFYSVDDMQLLIKAKYYLKTIIIQYIENKLELSNEQTISATVFLAGLLSQMFRWSESFFYLQKVSEKSSYSRAYSYYLSATMLSEIKDKTCLNYNGLLLLKIIDSATSGRKERDLLGEQKKQLKTLEKSTRKFIRQNNISVTELRRHKSKMYKNQYQLSKYESFVQSKYLYLNEHVFFCNCKKSLRDDISIETSHDHTRLKWLDQYKLLLEKISADYVLARNEFYFSLENTELYGHNLNRANKSRVFRVNYKKSLILSSFKNCYSLLDTIGMAVISSMESTCLAHRKEEFSDEKIYFLNLWDVYNFEENIFTENPFLMSLKTIALDLNNDKYAALKSFKMIRNAIEHKTVMITDNEKIRFEYDALLISLADLSEKTEILLNLTKSAIFCFVYFLRRMSKIIESGKVRINGTAANNKAPKRGGA